MLGWCCTGIVGVDFMDVGEGCSLRRKLVDVVSSCGRFCSDGGLSE